MNKKNIAIAMGGYSAEYDISINSGEVVYQSLNSDERFDVFRVIVAPDAWYVLDERNERHPIQKDDFSFHYQDKNIHFDAVFNAVHGNPGEDGPLAGYFDMLGIPYTSSGLFASALTFNKAECNMVLGKLGFKTPEAIYLAPGDSRSTEQIGSKTSYPCFVKPSRSGSSIGVSKVKSTEELAEAIALARKVDPKVLIEKAVIGLELACGVSDHEGKARALAITHIKPKNEFFDYESKYSGLSEEVTPAQIPAAVYEQIMAMSEAVYQKLELSGLARVDYILEEKSGEPVLIEVNTVPGLSENSLLPQQALHAKISLNELFSGCIEKVLSKRP